MRNSKCEVNFALLGPEVLQVVEDPCVLKRDSHNTFNKKIEKF